MNDVDGFINYLRRIPSSPACVQLYKGRDRMSRLRRENLERYLRKMQELTPQVLLVGEAPGHKGCGLTGIPFSSERLLAEHPFFSEFQSATDPASLASESSATIVWEGIAGLSSPPLLWNAFPFHPYKGENLRSNRAPNREELLVGKRVLKRLIQLFPIRTYVAVGQKASNQLEQMEIPFQAVRHPSFGGKKDFLKGLQRHLP
jgi:hypothetical protein